MLELPPVAKLPQQQQRITVHGLPASVRAQKSAKRLFNGGLQALQLFAILCIFASLRLFAVQL
jgi:hypothetical protein